MVGKVTIYIDTFSQVVILCENYETILNKILKFQVKLSPVHDSDHHKIMTILNKSGN